MKIKIQQNNPFGCDRYGFLWQILAKYNDGHGSRCVHLDYGAYDGAVIAVLAKSGVVGEGVGLDVNADIVEKFKTTLPHNVRLETLSNGQRTEDRGQKIRLPYPDEHFDSACILDVIEHIHDQSNLLKEIHRVLRKDGCFVVTVPKKHIFSFLDAGNFKFYFPRLHRFFYETKHSKEEYRVRYVECKNGLFGDIEKEKMWHQHFSTKELGDLLEKYGFCIVHMDGSGLFMRPLSILKYLLPGTNKVFDWLISFDSRLFSSSNLFCEAKKQS